MAPALPPLRPGDSYAADPLLRDCLARLLPADMVREIDEELAALGVLSGGALYDLQLADRLNEPRLVQWDAWGNRMDHIELTPLWRSAARLAAEHGLVAIPYERRHGRWSRVHQFAAVYLFHPSSDLYTCPLAMSDGAASALLASGNAPLIERALPRLTSRDPDRTWTSGQWMTELAGGSDVGATSTRAVPAGDGTWRLHGRKWFASAATAEMALALARPDGSAPGRGAANLALFYLETRNDDGTPNGVRVDRLKDKLGTRKLPTAELTLDGAVATAVRGTTHGTRAVEPMLRITRAWNAVSAAATMRRAVALARAYAGWRHAFGAPLDALLLHRETLADLEAVTRAATLLALELGVLMGRDEHGGIDDLQRALLRLLTPVAKLVTAKQAVAVVTEAAEALGGAGYIENTGMPALVRDVHVLPIWEGTTNVLALDALLRGDPAAELDALRHRVAEAVAGAPYRLAEPAARAVEAAEHAARWLQSDAADRATAERGARRFACTVGRALELALLVEHAGWAVQQDRHAASAMAAAERFARSTIDIIQPHDPANAPALLGDR